MNTSSFPEELAQNCLSCDENTEEDPGDLLQLVLSVLQDCHANDEQPLSSLQTLLAQQLSIPSTTNLPNLLYSTLTTTSDTTISSTTTTAAWPRGLQLISKLLPHPSMTPLELHSVILQSAASTRNEENPNHLFWTLLVLLSVRGLEQCQSQITRGEKVRYKRIKSLLLETIQLYQRQAIGNNYHTEDEQAKEEETACPTSLSVPLWVDFVLPTGRALWKLFPDTIRSPTSLFWEALSIGIASQLVVRLDSTEQLYSSILAIPTISLDSFLCHPWRFASFQSARIPTARRSNPQESLDWWTLERSQEQVQEDNDNDDDDESTSIPPDEFEGIDTTWNELGIAMLATRAWQDRPYAYHPMYQWRLWFPHVAICMNPDQHATNQTATRGISLLLELLSTVPPRSLSWNGSFSIHAQTSSIPATTKKQSRPPDHPVGTFQLLLNSIVASAQVKASTMQQAQICQDLLSKYQAHCQVALILDHLLPSCPHPGLKPKLLDMLRPLVRGCSSSCSRLKPELQRIVAELGTFVDHNHNHQQKLQKAGELIDQGEYFVSALGLIHLGGFFADSAGSIQLQSSGEESLTLCDFAEILKKQLVEWDTMANDADVPDQFFRLNLLDMSIQQLIGLPLGPA